jgi:hypothetical protein
MLHCFICIELDQADSEHRTVFVRTSEFAGSVIEEISSMFNNHSIQLSSLSVHNYARNSYLWLLFGVFLTYQ